MSDEVSLPAAPSYAATIEEIRDWSQRLHQWLAVREPLADGDVLDKFLTGRNAVSLGLASLSLGSTTVGNSSSGLVPGFGTYSPSDVTQPDSIANLSVTPGVSYFFVEFDAPTYRQGGGNGRTVIYSATYSGAGPLPTFANAVEVYQCFGAANIAIVSAEPGAVLHFWAKAESRAGILQATATGGTNGVSATCGPIDGGTAMIADFSILDAKIVSLSVAKLLAGSIDVGEYIQSTGYVAGTTGWRIHGDGSAEFSNVTVRGTLIVGTTPAVSGTTMTGSGAIFNTGGTWAAGNATTNISFNGTTMTLNGDVVATANINANAVTVPLTYSTDTDYVGTGAAQEVLSYTFSMPTAGTVIVFWAGQGGYTGLDAEFSFVVYLDAVEIGRTRTGTAYEDAPFAIAFGSASAGSREITVEMDTSSDYTLGSQKIVVLGVQR